MEVTGKDLDGVASLAEPSAQRLAEAESIIQDMLSLMWTDEMMKEPLFPSDRAWMVRAREFLEAKRVAV